MNVFFFKSSQKLQYTVLIETTAVQKLPFEVPFTLCFFVCLSDIKNGHLLALRLKQELIRKMFKNLRTSETKVIIMIRWSKLVEFSMTSMSFVTMHSQ